MKKLLFFFLIATFVFPMMVSATIGVGVGIGKIVIDKPIKPGGVYDLTSLVVLNTGDEPSDYEITTAYQSGQPELKPLQEWFSFSPSPFHLKPGEVKNVAVKLTLPIQAKPGDYFAYLQAQPAKKITTAGGSSIGVAAATKLYFTVVPSNIWQGIYYRFTFLYSRYHPWDTIVLVIVFVAGLIYFLSKKFKFQIAKK